MAPKRNTENSTAASTSLSTVGLTDNDMKLLDIIFKNSARASKPNPMITLDEVAQELGLKSAKVVQDRYRQILNKVGWFVTDAAPTAGDRTPKKTPVGRKQKAVAEADDEDDEDNETDEANETEQPALKKRKTTKKAVKEENGAGGGGAKKEPANKRQTSKKTAKAKADKDAIKEETGDDSDKTQV